MKKFQIISPVDGSVYAERDYAAQEQINDALQLSQKAQKDWRSTPLSDRKAMLTKAVAYFQEHVGEMAFELTHLMGRPSRQTPFEITGGFKDRALHMISIAKEALSDEQPEPIDGFKRYIKKEPLGTVLVLSPWNYPYLTAVNAVFPALLAGNTVILKHADQTALCAERFKEAFDHAGLPEGVFQYLHMSHDQVAHLIKDEGIDHVAFTGSVSGGHAIQKAASEQFIATGLELGGKDAAYVREDALLKPTIENLVDGSFFNSGQSCCGIERIYVHEKVYDQFVNFFAQLTLEYVLGNPTAPEVTLGPVVNVKAAEKIQAQIADAINKGAKSIIDASSFPNHLGLPYLPPQVLVNVNHEMDIMKEETFGPVAAIMKVSSDEEAISLINDSKYGLTASIWTANNEKAVEIGNQLEVGTVYMNRCDYLDPALAWTGCKGFRKRLYTFYLGF